MKARISSTLNTPVEDAWSAIKQSKTLIFVTKGFLGFKEFKHFPEEWVEGNTEHTKLMFFGVIPGWQHRLHFSRISNKHRELLTNEGGGLIPHWQHRMKVTPISATHCIYLDEIDVKAGAFTLPVWLYANIFYRYRQRRWKKLIKNEYSTES